MQPILSLYTVNLLAPDLSTMQFLTLSIVNPDIFRAAQTFSDTAYGEVCIFYCGCSGINSTLATEEGSWWFSESKFINSNGLPPILTPSSFAGSSPPPLCDYFPTQVLLSALCVWILAPSLLNLGVCGLVFEAMTKQATVLYPYTGANHYGQRS